jgi:hypothetical protein
VIVELKEPAPPPLVVFVDRKTVGEVEVLQHTPLADTAAPPSLVMFPPPVAVVTATAETALVVSLGSVEWMVSALLTLVAAK